MGILNPDSLALTLDALNEVFFYSRSLSNFQREQVANWIAGRQDKPGSYANMFAPTESDYKEGIRLFTGERVRSRAATGHILGEETCRALNLLDVSNDSVQNALNRASLGMITRLALSKRTPGMYCCGKCSVSLWRHLTVGGFVDTERELEAGMEALKLYRDGNGRWKRFPFYYTLLALSEIELPSAIREMEYTAPLLTRLLKRTPKDDNISERRRLLAERILEKI